MCVCVCARAHAAVTHRATPLLLLLLLLPPPRRAGCSVRTARACRPPTLLRLLGLAAPLPPWEEVEACEQREMGGCVEQQRPACEAHATAFCADAFWGCGGAAR